MCERERLAAAAAVAINQSRLLECEWETMRKTYSNETPNAGKQQRFPSVSSSVARRVGKVSREGGEGKTGGEGGGGER